MHVSSGSLVDLLVVAVSTIDTRRSMIDGDTHWPRHVEIIGRLSGHVATIATHLAEATGSDQMPDLPREVVEAVVVDTISTPGIDAAYSRVVALLET